MKYMAAPSGRGVSDKRGSIKRKGRKTIMRIGWEDIIKNRMKKNKTSKIVNMEQ